MSNQTSDMKEAIRLYYRGEIFEAERILKHILQEDPDNINALVRYANILKDLGKDEEAGSAYLKIAGLYEKEGSHEECLDFLEMASGLPEAITAQIRGRCLFRLGRYAEALSDFALLPQSIENLFFTGKIYFALTQYDNALKTFREILSQSSDPEVTFRACYWIGKSLYALGELEDAISCFNSYISFYPDEAEVFFELALCHLNSGHFEEANSNLLRFKDLGGSIERANLYLGIVNYRLGNYYQTIDLLDKTSLSGQSLHWKGLAYYELGIYEHALKCFSEAAKHEARPLYYKMMGISHLKMKRFFEAKICFEKALSIDPSDEETKKLLSFSGQRLK